MARSLRRVFQQAKFAIIFLADKLAEPACIEQEPTNSKRIIRRPFSILA